MEFKKPSPLVKSVETYGSGLTINYLTRSSFALIGKNDALGCLRQQQPCERQTEQLGKGFRDA